MQRQIALREDLSLVKEERLLACCKHLKILFSLPAIAILSRSPLHKGNTRVDIHHLPELTEFSAKCRITYRGLKNYGIQRYDLKSAEIRYGSLQNLDSSDHGNTSNSIHLEL